MIRLLHTSDWHLGVSMETASCEEEQSLFLDWLGRTLWERRIDVLVVAGDVFHRRNPPNSARQMYFRFLRSCRDIETLQAVVIVGGNHDSPSGLEAPAAVLETMKVHVVGTLDAREESLEEFLVPIEGPAGVELVVAAVPYMPDARLGLSAIGLGLDEARQSFAEGFAALYSRLADAAEELSSGAARVATGHLTAAAQEPFRAGDYHTPLHSVGGVDTLPSSVFDRRWDYVALGHIHRAMAVDGERVWYAGTPVATARTESGPRQVLEVCFEGGERVAHAALEVPRFRPLHVIRGDRATVLEELRYLPATGTLQPYVFLDFEELHDPSAKSPEQELRALLDEWEGPPPRVVRTRVIRPDTDEPESLLETAPHLEDLHPEEVFSMLYRRDHGMEPPPEILQALRQLLPEADEIDEPTTAPAPLPEEA